jgi:hypothetical protein
MGKLMVRGTRLRQYCFSHMLRLRPTRGVPPGLEWVDAVDKRFRGPVSNVDSRLESAPHFIDSIGH